MWGLPGFTFNIKFGIKGVVRRSFLDHIFYSDVPCHFFDGFGYIGVYSWGLNTEFGAKAEGRRYSFWGFGCAW